MMGDVYEPFLIAKIGWMNRYAGYTAGDPQVIANSRHVKMSGGKGNEAYNFHIVNGQLYGHAQPPPRAQKLNLSRIVKGFEGDSVDGVLVIFIASHPETHKQVLVGWYKGATVHPRMQKTKVGGYVRHYQVRAKVGLTDTVLLPNNLRIPFEGPQIRYVYYPLDKGRVRNSKWLTKTVKFVTEYDGGNWLFDNSAEADAQTEMAAQIAEERAAGFPSDPRVRKAVEDRAVSLAQAYFESRGYQCTVKGKPYDLLCHKPGETLYVEVKGPQTPNASSIVVTKNEVDLAQQEKSVLFLVHSITVTGRKKPKATGGVYKILHPWGGDEFLTVTQYRFDVLKATTAVTRKTRAAMA
jgi:hypothetical protein